MAGRTGIKRDITPSQKFLRATNDNKMWRDILAPLPKLANEILP